MISSPYRGFALMEGNGEGLFFLLPRHTLRYGLRGRWRGG